MCARGAEQAAPAPCHARAERSGSQGGERSGSQGGERAAALTAVRRPCRPRQCLCTAFTARAALRSRARAARAAAARPPASHIGAVELALGASEPGDETSVAGVVAEAAEPAPHCVPEASRLARSADEARALLPGAAEVPHCSSVRPSEPRSAEPGAAWPRSADFAAACSASYFCNGFHSGCWQCREPPVGAPRCVPDAERVTRAQADADGRFARASEVGHCSLVSSGADCAGHFHCVGTHGACFRCAEPGHAARAAGARAQHRPHTTVNGRGNATERWDPAVPCFDSNFQFERLSGKHTCAEAVSHCAQGETGWRIVRAYCPLSCGLCVSRDPNATAGAESAADEGAGAYEVAVGGRDYETDVVVGPSAELVAASRVVFTTSMPPTFVDVYETYLEQQRALDNLAASEPPSAAGGGAGGGGGGAQAPRAFVYHMQYEFGYADWVMPSFGAQNIAMAACAVLGCVSLFLPVSVALLCTFSVLCIDVLLLGGMAVLQTPLNTITLVSLLLAMALAIDYSCHIGAPTSPAGPRAPSAVAHSLHPSHPP